MLESLRITGFGLECWVKDPKIMKTCLMFVVKTNNILLIYLFVNKLNITLNIFLNKLKYYVKYKF